MQIKVTIDVEVPQVLKDIAGLLLPKDGKPTEKTAEPAPVMEVAVREPEPPKTAAPLTLSDAKEAMNAARVRIEGEKYQDSTTEGHKLYHKELTEKMKSLMLRANPDAMRPADLTPPQLTEFIMSLGNLELKDGKIVEALPF